MAFHDADSPDEKLKLIVQQISKICLSEEFQVLQQELEAMYVRCKVANSRAMAFQDALYSLLVQNELGTSNSQSRAY